MNPLPIVHGPSATATKLSCSCGSNCVLTVFMRSKRVCSTRITSRAAVGQTLLDLIDTGNTPLDPHEQLSFVAVAEGPWTIGNGFITPTLKLKRNVLENRYQPCVDDWMSQNRPVVWETPPEAVSPAAS